MTVGVGVTVGLAVGWIVGIAVGVAVGINVGVAVGIEVGAVVGINVGVALGRVVGVIGAVTGGVRGSSSAWTVRLWCKITDKGEKIANNKNMIAGLISFFFIGLPFCFWNWGTDIFEFPKVVVFLTVINFYIFKNLTNGIITFSGLKSNQIKSVNWILIALMGWLIVSSLFQGNLNSWFGQYYRYQGIVTLLGYIGWYWLVKKSFYQLNPMVFCRIMSVGGLLQALFIISQRFFLSELRLAGNLGNPNFAGGYLALVAAFINNWIILGMIGLATWLTGSRSALIAFVLVIMVKLWQRVKSKKVFLTLLGCISVVVVIGFPHRAESVFDRREIIWQKSIEAILARPVLGWGVENFVVAFNSRLKPNEFDLAKIRVDKAHNELLEIGVAGGVPAMALYLILLVVAIRGLWRNHQYQLYSQALLCLVTFVLVSSLNVVNITEYLFFYLVLGITACSTVSTSVKLKMGGKT